MFKLNKFNIYFFLLPKKLIPPMLTSLGIPPDTVVEVVGTSPTPTPGPSLNGMVPPIFETDFLFV